MQHPHRPTLTAVVALALLVPAGAAGATGDPSSPGAGTTVVTGALQVAVAEDVAGATTMVAFAEVDGALVDVTGLVPADTASTGDAVTVTLDAAGDAVAADVAPSAAATAPDVAPAVVAQTGTITVLPVFWTAPDAQTPETLAALARTAGDYWATQSAGRVTTSAVAARPWAQIPAPTGCDAAAIFNSALAANPAVGGGAYDRVVVYFPKDTDCQWVGLATIGQGSIWVNGYGYSDTFSHEFGHTLGLGHASARLCTTATGPAPWADTGCAVRSYEDGDDVMGWALYRAAAPLNTALADQLGWARTVAPSASAAVTATLAPLSAVTGVRALKIPFSGGLLYVDYRPASDARYPTRVGVQVHRVPVTSAYHDSELLDMHSALPGYSAVASTTYSLPPGTTYAVPGTDYVVAVLGVDAAGAAVSLVSRKLDATAPSAPVIARPSSGWWPSTATIAWSPASDAGVGMAGYTVAVDGRVAAVVPAGSTSTTIAVPPTGTVTVTATDRAGNSTAASVVSGSPVAPSRPVITTAAGTHPNPVQLTWTGPGPSAGVAAYVVTAGGRDRALAADATTRRLTLDPGTYTVTVSAVDGAGTRTMSDPVTLTVTDAPDPGLSDVWPGHPFFAPIAWMRAAGITTGSTLPDGTLGYDGSGAVSRQAMAAFLYRLAGRPAFTPPATSPFADVRVGDPFYAEIAWLAQSGVSTGWSMADGSVQFRPGEAVSREAMAAFLYRFAGKPVFTPPAASPFVDVTTAHPFYAAITWLSSSGISSGWAGPTGAEFRPGTSIERQAMAAFLYRLDKAS